MNEFGYLVLARPNLVFQWTNLDGVGRATRADGQTACADGQTACADGHSACVDGQPQCSRSQTPCSRGQPSRVTTQRRHAAAWPRTHRPSLRSSDTNGPTPALTGKVLHSGAPPQSTPIAPILPFVSAGTGGRTPSTPPGGSLVAGDFGDSGTRRCRRRQSLSLGALGAESGLNRGSQTLVATRDPSRVTRVPRRSGRG